MYKDYFSISFYRCKYKYALFFLKVEYLIQHEMLLLLVEEMVTLAYRY